MGIDPKVEKPTREMLGRAIRGEFDELATMIETIGEDRFQQCLGLCLPVSGYIAIDVSGRKWPARDDVREIATVMAGVDMEFKLAESDVCDYLTRAALGFEPLVEVFPDLERAGRLPILVTATLLVAYRGEDRDWWDYLDEIEGALETAAPLPEKVVPALLLFSRRNRALKAAANGPNHG